MSEPTPLTGDSTIAVWIEHPIGAPIIAQLLTALGRDDSVLAQIQNLPLNTLVAMSQGQLSQDVVDDLVRQANGGVLPERETSVPPIGSSRFAGKTIIVTGAGSGIGRATAERILAEGGRVVAVDIATDRLDSLVDASPAEAVIAVAGDITDDADIARIVEAAGDKLDGLANVAGIMDGMLPLHETDDQVWDRVLAINVTGAFKLTRAVLPSMLAEGRGTVVNVASEASLRGNAAGTAYTASKHAVVGMTKSAAFFYGSSGIRVNAVAPGPTATGIAGEFRSEFAEARISRFFPLLPPVTTAETLAASITWLLSDDSTNVNGQVLASDGGWSVQ
ncbi:SDR family NAD(P)-dependent oxidoreductase [Herbiconiux sp. VKM Ac-2851]|uniref:SDR family NAD(P)-dependent oxidoreductase n=1 Tax=Herbiconiux sp. VKM Ac-2851 TaxID=2739025 RepID=UPI00156457E6|nr:SDR family oxidoreductase [Herbiconiux sp. VKM Ac-2851]NQX35704.1 SDR family oxidoreductase [Herbiconiux sp. VKM Ac-2851]